MVIPITRRSRKTLILRVHGKNNSVGVTEFSVGLEDQMKKSVVATERDGCRRTPTRLPIASSYLKRVLTQLNVERNISERR